MKHSELRSIREGLGLTQAEFADAIGISRVFVGLMERGQKPISKRTAEAAKAACGKPLDATSTEPDPLYRQLEKALISAGLSFDARHDADAELVEYKLLDLDMKLVVSRFENGALGRTIKTGDQGLFVLGTRSAKLIIDLIALAGGRASRVPL